MRYNLRDTAARQQHRIKNSLRQDPRTAVYGSRRRLTTEDIQILEEHAPILTPYLVWHSVYILNTLDRLITIRRIFPRCYASGVYSEGYIIRITIPYVPTQDQLGRFRKTWPITNFRPEFLSEEAHTHRPEITDEVLEAGYAVAQYRLHAIDL